MACSHGAGATEVFEAWHAGGSRGVDKQVRDSYEGLVQASPRAQLSILLPELPVHHLLLDPWFAFRHTGAAAAETLDDRCAASGCTPSREW